MIEVIPTHERPRERCLSKGADCLSLRECLALVLGSGPRSLGCLGLAARILNRPGGGLEESEQERAFFTAMEIEANAHLGAITGLGDAGRARLMAAFELGRRYALFRERSRALPREKPQLPDLTWAALDRVLPRLRQEPQEWLGFMPCYRSGELGGLCVVERGVRTHVNVDPAELFARVLALRPSGIFLFHNHPSGDLTPSPSDYDLSERVRKLCRELGIQLLGHWIVAPEGERWIDFERRLR